MNRNKRLPLPLMCEPCTPDALIEAVRGLRVAEPDLGFKPLLAKLRQQQPDLGAATKEVREALTVLKAEGDAAKAAAAPPAADKGVAPSNVALSLACIGCARLPSDMDDEREKHPICDMCRDQKLPTTYWCGVNCPANPGAGKLHAAYHKEVKANRKLQVQEDGGMGLQLARGMSLLEDEVTKLRWREGMRRAQKAYDIQWLAERMPTDDYLARGAQHVANPAVSIFRVVGEPSACQMVARRLGAPSAEREMLSEPDVELQRAAKLNEDSAAESQRTDAAWRRLCDADWMNPVIKMLVDAAPAERKAGVLHELREMQGDLQFVESRPCGVPHLRQFAQAMYPCKDDLTKCHGWDAHVLSGGDGAFTKVKVTARLLWMATAMLIRTGFDEEGYRLMACPCCLQQNNATLAWQSLHPCMHWLCDTCTNEWVHRRGNRVCPFRCEQPILFTQGSTRP